MDYSTVTDAGPTLTSIFTHAAVYGAAGITGLSAAFGSFFTNKPYQDTIITRFDKPVKTKTDAGWSLKLPFIDKVAKRIDTSVIQATEKLSTKTKAGDDVYVSLPITVRYQVSDSFKYAYVNKDPVANMMVTVSKAVRVATSNKSLQDLFDNREGISQEVIAHVAEEVAKSGITLHEIIIDQPGVPPEIQSASNNVQASIREREAATNQAEAGRITVIAQSLAAAEAQKNAGKGAADFRKAILEGYKAQLDELTKGDGAVSREEALTIVMKAMTLDAMRDVAKEGNLLIVPADFSGSNFAEVQTLRNLKTAAPAPAAA